MWMQPPVFTAEMVRAMGYTRSLPALTKAERLERRIWRTAGGQLIPLGEMSHRHLLNLPGFLKRLIGSFDFTKRFMPYLWNDDKEQTRTRWVCWLALVNEEIARRDVW